MKKFVLDLTTWEVEIPVQKMDKDDKPYFIQEKTDYPVKENLGLMLRAGGLFDNTEDTVEAIIIGKSIQSHKKDSIEIDERELNLLKQCLDRHLKASTEGKGIFGGPQHENLIVRIYNLWKNKNAEGK